MGRKLNIENKTKQKLCIKSFWKVLYRCTLAVQKGLYILKSGSQSIHMQWNLISANPYSFLPAMSPSGLQQSLGDPCFVNFTASGLCNMVRVQAESTLEMCSRMPGTFKFCQNPCSKGCQSNISQFSSVKGSKGSKTEFKGRLSYSASLNHC